MKIFLKYGNLLVLIILCLTAGAGYGYDVRIGVLANSGPEKCQKMWSPTAKYLSSKLPDYKFRIVPLSFDNIYDAVRNEEIDFLLANPSFYIDLEKTSGISRIATLKNKLSSDYPLFGSVIFTRADNSKIYKLGELSGKKFVAVAPGSFAGWQTALRELKKGGIDPYKDFADLQFTGNHEAAIYSVLEGKADAGTANTDEFDDLIKRGKIKLRDFRVIVPDWIGISKEFPHPVSTRLYPDWPFAKLRKTPEDLATRVAIALLKMGGNDEAARAANCYGWSYPLNYQSVDELKKELGLGIYRHQGEPTFGDTFRKHKKEFLSVFVIFVILMIASIVLGYLYRRTKKSEESLIKSEKQIKDITSSLAEGIYVLSEQGHIIFMNPEAEHLLGWTFAELSHKNAHDMVHCMKADGSPLSLKECSMHKVIRTGIPLISRDEVFTRKDGAIFPVSVVCSPIMEDGKVVAAVTAFRDITEDRNLEVALINSENKYRTLLENIPDRIFLKDRNSVYISCNGPFAYDQKISASEIAGKTDYDFFSKEHSEKYRADDKRIIETGEKEDFEEEYLLDGSKHVAHTVKTPVKDSNGNIVGILGVFRDITDRKLAEAEREQFYKFFQTSADLMAMADPNGAFMKTNPACTETLGYSGAELVAKPFIEFIHPDDKQATLDEMTRQLQRGFSFNFENRYICKDGSVRWLSWRAIFNKDEGITYATARDITEHKRMETEREKLVAGLQEALAKVKQLSGLLPICASCKKIRDDKGYWNQIETYISEHSEALFSHAICPECGKKLYPEIYDEVWGKEDKQ